MSAPNEVFAACVSMITDEVRVRNLNYVFGWSRNLSCGPYVVIVMHSSGFHKFRLIFDPAAGTLELEPPTGHRPRVTHVSVSLSDPNFVKTIVNGMVNAKR